MAHFLHRLGVYSYEKKWLIIAGWAVIIALLGGLAAVYIKPVTNAISIPGTEAQKTLNRANELFPGAGKGSARLVFETPQNKTIYDYQQQITQSLDNIKKVSGVSGVVSPFVYDKAISADKHIAYAQVQLVQGNGSIEKTTIDSVKAKTDQLRSNGLVVETGGDLINRAPTEILGIGEIVGVLIALMVLVITLGSLVSAGMPIATALVAIGVSMGGLFALSQLVDITSTTPVLAIMLGLAVGIDYSLFIISKYRSYLLDGFSYKDAVGKSIATAGNAVVFAAVTVVIALSALSVVQIPFMSTMGLAGAGTIAVAAMVAITLIPALMGLAGDKIFGRKVRQSIKAAQVNGPRDEHAPHHETIWYKWGRAITRHPVVILVSALIVIGIVAWPARQLTLGLPTDENAVTTSTERKAYSMLERGFGAGFNGPLVVVAENMPKVSTDEKNAISGQIMTQYGQQVIQQRAALRQQFDIQISHASSKTEVDALESAYNQAFAEMSVKQQAALTQVQMQSQTAATMKQLSVIANNIKKNGNVQDVIPSAAVEDGSKGIIQVIPKQGPSDEQTRQLLAYIRDPSHRQELTGGMSASLAVTGSTALQMDINNKLSNALPLYLAVVIGLSLILLMIAFRSILIPIKATLGFLLSVAAMFGALVAVFQWGWLGIAQAPGPIVSFIPILAIGILFGLAMDYEFFLVSSMHESYERNRDAHRAVVDGFGLGSKVVTAAAVIMVAVFSGFIANHDATVQAIGFALAIGILIDAFIVRMTIVPAVMTLLGKSAWWLPKWLDRATPHISIEGEADPSNKS